MLKKVRNAWSDFFSGTYVVPIRTYAKHPVCLIIWIIICSIPSLLVLFKMTRDEEIEKKIVERHTYKPFYTESEDK